MANVNVKVRQLINPGPYWEQLKALQIHCFGRGIPLIATDDGWWWIATVEGDVVVGYATMRAATQTKDSAYMSRCGVHKAYRGQGLQHRFIKVRERFARKMGYCFVVTDTTTNPPSANNLIDHGFKTHTVSGGYAETIGWYKDLKNKKTSTANKPKRRKV